ncbi:MAG: BamA/TamA family outer membrane protein [Candidatus Cloacimonetes bacterium]|jgi:outer membrane protein assembly factor BamA|nr:BamA/TamA family outer membrane protein [Candidatus Cloacimonadota bacterium]
MLKFKLFWLLLLFCTRLNAELTIGEITFVGNQLISDKDLVTAISSSTGSVFNQKLLNKDTEHISEYYSNKGLFNIKVYAPQIITNSPTRIDVIFQIKEFSEILVTNLKFTGNSYITDSKLSSILPNRELTLLELAGTLRILVEYYADNGFLYADVKLDSLLNKNEQFTAFLKIDEGKFCQFTKYKFNGNKTTRDETLIRISRLEGIDNITPAILQQAANNIRKKRYIKNCDLIPLDHRKLLFQVEEDRMSLISGILGYDNSKEGTNRVTGWVDLEFMNLYGTDRSLALNWQHLSADISSIELKYHESGISRYPINADLTVFRQEVDSTYIKSKFESEIYYYDLYNRYGLFFGMEDIFPGSGEPATIEKSSFKKLGVLWNITALDNILNPSSGIEIYLKYYYIFNTIDGKDLRKQAVEIKWAKYFDLRKNFVLGFDVNANVIENKLLTEFEVFDLGGAKSLRGFNENVFSGFRVGWSDIELRYLFGQNSRLFTFGAYGDVENQDYKYSDLFSFGFGLRTQTKMGLVGIDYGLGIQKGEMRNPLDGIIHIGIETGL